MGANITLEVAAPAPTAAGNDFEMPVLDNAIPACGVAFTPLLFALTFGEPVMRRSPAGPARFPASASRSGSTSGSTGCAGSRAERRGAPGDPVRPHRTRHQARKSLKAPALVIGHPRDPVHPFSDADMLAAELPNARLIDANSIVELRIKPSG